MAYAGDEPAMHVYGTEALTVRPNRSVVRYIGSIITTIPTKSGIHKLQQLSTGKGIDLKSKGFGYHFANALQLRHAAN